MLLTALIPFGDKLEALKNWFIAFGPFGAFLISLVDSFIPLPGGADLSVIALSAREPSLAPVTVLAASFGAVVGSTMLYLGARRAGAVALAKISPARRARIENLLGRFDVLSIAVAALLPPPFPFKAFNLSAGVLKIRPWRFVLGVGAGRFLRFAIEAALAVRYGDEAADIIRRHGLKILGAVVVAGIAFWAFRRFGPRRRDAAEPIAPENAGGPAED